MHPNSISVAIDGVTYDGVSESMPLVIAPLAAGRHELELRGLPLTCAVEGDHPRAVTVVEGDTTEVDLSIRCEPAAGAVHLTTLSQGEEIDPNGYRLLVDGMSAGRISASGALTLPLPAGPRTMELGHLNANCSTGGNPRELVVPAGGVIATRFVVSCTPAPPVGRGREVAFVTDRNGSLSDETLGDHIYLMNEDGSGVRPLPTSGSVLYEKPTWSADGTRLLLEGSNPITLDEHIYLLDLSGNPPVLIPNTLGLGQPAWSPDGARIAFVADDAQIWIADVDGLNGRQVTSEFGGGESPSWSQDGNRIAFINSVSDGDGFTVSRILIHDLRDSSLTEVYTIEDFLSDVRWSPNGNTLAFSGSIPGTFQHQIQVLDLSGDAGPRSVSSGDFDVSPSWSPDGSRIAFERFDDRNVYMVNVDGTDELRITDAPGFDGEPAWRP